MDRETLVQLEAKRKIEQFEIQFIESNRFGLNPEDIGGIIHKMDTLAPLDIRRKGGKFWTNVDLAEVTKQLIEDHVQPTYIFEPFVGGGSLVRGFVETCSGVVNDWDQYAIDLLKKEWTGYNWDFYVKNIHTTPINEIEKWIKIKEDDIFLIYTNPPFGTVSTNALASKANELVGASSRNITIRYGCDEKEEKLIKGLYGSGDLFLPSIGKLIELIKRKATGYLAFFCPGGAFMGRTRYQKIFDELLKNFRFLHGEIYSGKYFNNVSKQKAIAFTIWKYERNANTEKTSLKFMFEGKEYGLKIASLLKDGWKYDERESTFGEIIVQHCETFNSAPPKMFHLQPEKGGSEVVAQNVKIKLNVPNLCDQLLYALWSVTVGYRALVTPPVVFDNCYVHLPDFKEPRVQEILALSALYVLIEELTNKYCNGKIGFVGVSRVFVFGGSELTASVNYLFSTYGSLKIDGSRSLRDVLEALRKETDSGKIDKNLRTLIREQIKVRLDEVGYWDYLPIQ